MRMASYVAGELIPYAFVWHDPGITAPIYAACCGSRGLSRPSGKEAEETTYGVGRTSLTGPVGPTPMRYFGGWGGAWRRRGESRLRGWPCRTRSAPGGRQGVGGASPLR